MEVSESVSLKSFGFTCPSCGVPTSDVPMEYVNGEPAKPKAGWAKEGEIVLECLCCRAEGGDRDDPTTFTVKLSDYSESMKRAILAEAAEINARFGRKIFPA